MSAALAVIGRRKSARSADTDIETLRRDLASADAERADAVRIRQDLESRRATALDSETTLRQHDEQVAAAGRRIEVAEARYLDVAEKLGLAMFAAEQTRRERVRAAGVEAIKAANTLMVNDYVKAANAVSAVLTRVAELHAVAEAANADLPEGAAPIDLATEPFNGRQWRSGSEDIREVRLVHRETGEIAPSHIVSGPMYERRTVTARRTAGIFPQIPHTSIRDFVNLPGLKLEEYIYAAPLWGQPRVPR